MGAGIAKIFKEKFGGVDELLEQSEVLFIFTHFKYECRFNQCNFYLFIEKVPGQCAILKLNDRFVYYLVRQNMLVAVLFRLNF